MSVFFLAPEMHNEGTECSLLTATIGSSDLHNEARPIFLKPCLRILAAESRFCPQGVELRSFTRWSVALHDVAGRVFFSFGARGLKKEERHGEEADAPHRGQTGRAIPVLAVCHTFM